MFERFLTSSFKVCSSLSDKQYKKVQKTLYGFCKVCKAIVDVFLPFRPILFAIGTPNYKILLLILSCLTINEFTVKDYFSFEKEIVGQDSSFYIGSLPTFHLKKPLTLFGLGRG